MNVWTVYADLEQRGFTFKVRGTELSIAPATELTDDDDARITRFLGELIDLVQRYTDGQHGAAFMVACARAQLEAFTVDGRPRCQRCGGLAPADGCHVCDACLADPAVPLGAMVRATLRAERQPDVSVAA